MNKKTFLAAAVAAVLQLTLQTPALALALAHDDGESKLSHGVQAQIAEVRRATARFHDFNFAIHPNGGGYGAW